MLAQREKLLLSREVRAHMIGYKHCMWNFWIVIKKFIYLHVEPKPLL